MQTSRYPDLPEKSIGTQCGRQVWIEHLERHLAIVLEVAREIHDRHAAMANLAVDGIPVLENRSEVVLELGQTAFRKGCTLQYRRWCSPARELHHPDQAFIAAAITLGTFIQLEFSSSAVIRGINT